MFVCFRLLLFSDTKVTSPPSSRSFFFLPVVLHSFDGFVPALVKAKAILLLLLESIAMTMT